MNQYFPPILLSSGRCCGPVEGSTGDARLSLGSIGSSCRARDAGFMNGVSHLTENPVRNMVKNLVANLFKNLVKNKDFDTANYLIEKLVGNSTDFSTDNRAVLIT